MATVAVLLCLALVIAPLAVVGWQVVFWLKEGWWLPITVLDGMAYMGWQLPRPDQGTWEGIRTIIFGIEGLPLSLALFFSILASLLIFGWLYGAWERRAGH